MKKIGLIIVTLLLISCNSKDSEKVLKEANGRINHVLIVMKNSDWQGEIGDELRQIIAEPVLGLPQPEPQFEISQVPPENFGSMFRASRSVLKVGIASENNFTTTTNVYAEPQKIVTITGETKAEIINQIQQNSDKILSVFKDADINAIQKRIRKNSYDINAIETFTNLGVSLAVPKSYALVEDNGEMAWFRYRITGNNGLQLGSSMELFVYSAPLETEANLDSLNVVTMRDNFGKKYIPGQVEDSYMITEAAYTPHTFKVELAGKPALETRGKWEVKNVYMAGPFLNYTVLDEANSRLIVVEGLTYAPGVNKRDYMFELEAILKTLKMK